MTDQLFPGYPDPEPKPEMSTGQRMRARQQAAIDHGTHPLTKLPLAHNDHTCGDCLHRVRNERHYPKCDQTSMSRSEVSDCRAWWPACIAWTAREGS